MSVLELKWVPGAARKPKIRASLAKSGPRSNFHQILMDFGLHFGRLLGALGPLFGDLGGLWDIFSNFFEVLCGRFLLNRLSVTFFIQKSS